MSASSSASQSRARAMGYLRDVIEELAIDAAWTRHTKQLLDAGATAAESGLTGLDAAGASGGSDTGGASAQLKDKE